ncbi:hypothetical protein ACFE04_000951 [Oxalis oulophora]
MASTTTPPWPNRARSTSLRDSYDSAEKMEGAGSWEALEWTKVEPDYRPSSHANLEILFDKERIMAEIASSDLNPYKSVKCVTGHGVVLVNTDEAGTLIVTNFRLLFLSEGTRNVIALGTIPLATIEKFNKMVVKIQSAPRQTEKPPSRRLLQIIGKDMRMIVFGFRPRTKQRRAVYDALLKCTKPTSIWDLYVFACGPSKFGNTNPKVRLLNEYFRLLGIKSRRASMSMIENGSFTLSNELWRISDINSNYTLCQTYPSALIFPRGFSDEEVLQASSFRARCRLPVVSWCHPKTGAVLARSSQPLVGLMMNMRSNADEKLVAALCSQLTGGKGTRRKLYIADARPRKNALANGAMGGGSESSANYFQSEIVFFGIDNIHAMRESFSRLRDYLDTHGATSSDGMSSFLRHGGWTWGGGNLSSMSASVSTLGDSGWLNHVQGVLAGSAWIAARIALESASVLAHCSDGWDRTTQLVSLANLLLDPYYRTLAGFQALVEKDWLAFGHPFQDRVSMPILSGSFELTRTTSGGNFPSSPMRQSTGSSQSQAANTSHGQNNYSPIFLQWVDCVSQLLRMYPFAFEFSLAFLVDFLDCMLSCRFGNFLCNSERERQQLEIADSCGCLWSYLEDLRAKGRSHPHYNVFYDPAKHSGALLPPAAALAPTLWPQFHLRWACPSEAQSGEIDAHCRDMALKLSESQKAKEEAERKAKEISSSIESLKAQLKNEKLRNTSAINSAKKTSRENEAIKRAIQSLGCKVTFTNGGDCAVDISSDLRNSSSKSDGSLLQEDKSDMSLSISFADDSGNSVNQICESLCPLRRRDGACRWPDAGCAQLSSQFVGLKANYDAFDRLSINDSYFDA